MAQIVGAYFTSHVPAIGGAIHRGDEQTPYWKPFFDGFPPVQEWLGKVKPDVAVVFSNDHGLNFFLDSMPTFAVGAAPHYHNADEGWGLPLYPSFVGHPELSWHIIETLLEEEFDPVTCQQMLVDHAVSIPFALAYPKCEPWPLKLVPIGINTVQHPLPSAKRCLALGRAVHKALASWAGNERIVVVGTGGLSHQLDGERAGFMNPDYDRFVLDHLVNDPEAIIKDSIHEIVRLAGTQGVEVLNWIAARGALGPSANEIHRNYHVPISNTAAATVVYEPA
ncbi:class III extradiol dioxygenase family protein [Sphingobium fluviale]|uniref:Protocatechuate 3,4-dioxygenase n=1 Tax=Sphingobium fluviale TaxID=2506423 RepID=A0A4Q1KDI9_9SPHN|nr:class III extradiol dioxygenase family protein [Sphingobium fluviale]RXR26007.1 protocatechuate 3,4-dioxygenase [Sphingobium fluviale]